MLYFDELSFKDELKVKIVYYRKKRGLTQSQVAEKMGITRSTYAYAETRAERLSPDFLTKLAKALDVSPNVFIYEDINKGDGGIKNPPSPPIEPFVTTNKEQRTIMMLRLLPKKTFDYFYEEIRKEYENIMNSDD